MLLFGVRDEGDFSVTVVRVFESVKKGRRNN